MAIALTVNIALVPPLPRGARGDLMALVDPPKSPLIRGTYYLGWCGGGVEVLTVNIALVPPEPEGG